MKILILNGPNLNQLGKREPHLYSSHTLKDLENVCKTVDSEVVMRQTNNEGELITWVQEAPDHFKGLIINAGGYTHTSVALLDALLSIEPFPIIEVHLTLPSNREPFRHVSFVTPAARGIIAGLGFQGYILAIQALHSLQ